MTAVRCDARTRHVSQRYVDHTISEIRSAIVDIRWNRGTERAVTDIRNQLDDLEVVARNGPVVECGWTGQADPDSWTCPQCRTWHTTDEGWMNK